MTESQVFHANLISNVVALGILLVSWRWRNWGRFLFVAMFLWASQLNLRLAWTSPAVYLDYGRWAVTPYRTFINGAFARHVSAIVSVIALGQLAIALLVALKGTAVRIGLAGAVLFLLAIAPLGRGSAFPFSLTVSLAAVVLGRRLFPHSLWRAVRTRRGQSLTI